MLVITDGYGTSIHALRDRAQIQPGETLLVLGAAGGVGVTAIELGKLWGAHVIAAASSDEKLELCTKLGADQVPIYTLYRESIFVRIHPSICPWFLVY